MNLGYRGMKEKTMASVDQDGTIFVGKGTKPEYLSAPRRRVSPVEEGSTQRVVD